MLTDIIYLISVGIIFAHEVKIFLNPIRYGLFITLIGSIIKAKTEKEDDYNIRLFRSVAHEKFASFYIEEILVIISIITVLILVDIHGMIFLIIYLVYNFIMAMHRQRIFDIFYIKEEDREDRNDIAKIKLMYTDWDELTYVIAKHVITNNITNLIIIAMYLTSYYLLK